MADVSNPVFGRQRQAELCEASLIYKLSEID